MAFRSILTLECYPVFGRTEQNARRRAALTFARSTQPLIRGVELELPLNLLFTPLRHGLEIFRCVVGADEDQIALGGEPEAGSVSNRLEKRLHDARGIASYSPPPAQIHASDATAYGSWPESRRKASMRVTDGLRRLVRWAGTCRRGSERHIEPVDR